MKTALIAGATGLVGSELLQQLMKDNEYSQIHVLVRNPIDVKSKKIIVHQINFDELESVEINEKIDHVFCTLGTTIKKAKTKENFRKVDYDYVLALGRKAKEWNSEKFLMVSSLGANATSAIFYSRVKGEIENALKELGLPHLFIFRPSLLMGNRKEQRAGEKTAVAVYKIINPLFVGKLRKYKGIQARQVAMAMLNTAINKNESIRIFESDEIQKI
ncbi:MAG: oxidoreductase [Bacteroidales bacterium]